MRYATPLNFSVALHQGQWVQTAILPDDPMIDDSAPREARIAFDYWRQSDINKFHQPKGITHAD